MILEELTLENWRNFDSAELHFSSDRIFFEGGNGQGKSSLLEAIYYLANLRSFRTLKMGELKKIGKGCFRAQAVLLRKNNWKSVLEVFSGEQRSLRVDQIPVGKASDFTNKIRTVTFLPDDPLIINGPSPLRRRFFDMFISMMDRSYFQLLQEYLSALRNRNFLLKNHKNEGDLLYSYSQILARCGSSIVKKRTEYAACLTLHMQNLFNELYKDLESFSIRMRSSRESSDPEAYLERLCRETEHDLKRGFTSFGPHLDDFDFIFDNKVLRSFGSRGQCRMTSLILKLSQLEVIRETPEALKETVILLDDATTDLDTRSRQAFEEKIACAGQTFFAFTKVPEEYCVGKVDRFTVENGRVFQ
ncbi:MAG: DNA replication/repair protein RecF [Lentisphaeria bacterium]|nr:DNA replication/repair protein RecF [Lentisphaeria bacterium]